MNDRKAITAALPHSALQISLDVYRSVYLKIDKF